MVVTVVRLDRCLICGMHSSETGQVPGQCYYQCSETGLVMVQYGCHGSETGQVPDLWLSQ